MNPWLIALCWFIGLVLTLVLALPYVLDGVIYFYEERLRIETRRGEMLDKNIGKLHDYIDLRQTVRK